MYLPRAQITQLYTRLLATTHPSSPPLLILTALTVDALCATRILTALLKRDFVPHKVQPVSGYSELQKAGEEHVRGLRKDVGGEGGVVVCLGCGGGVDLGEILGLENTDVEEEVERGEGHGVEVWVLDAHRGWNLENVFGSGTTEGKQAQRGGVQEGKVMPGYRGTRGGIIVWDNDEVETELLAEKEAYFALQNMPEITEDDVMLEGSESVADDGEANDEDDESVPSSSPNRKRKADAQESDTEAHDDSGDERPTRRRRSNSGTPIPRSPHNPTSAQPSSPSSVIPSSPPKQPSQRELRRQLLKLRRKHEATIERYYTQGSWISEPVSSLLYGLASELGREDNELLWLAIVGIESVGLSPYNSNGRNSDHDGAFGGRRAMDRSELLKQVLRDEVRRLNPLPESDLRRSASQSALEAEIPTIARSATDTSIRLSPEPRFLLIRHWSLYDSMLHSSYLATRLHVWNEQGRKRLNKLLAKMGISLQEARKGYLHLDVEIKRSLRKRILKFAEQYNLDGLVPDESGDGAGWTGKRGWGFVRSWGWRGTMSATDVSTVVSAILEVGPSADAGRGGTWAAQDLHFGNKDHSKEPSYNSRLRAGLPSPPHSSDSGFDEPSAGVATNDAPDWTTRRFFAAYDALSPSTSHHQQGLQALLHHIPTAQLLARAILRTGSALIAKHQIRHLRSFRMGVVKEGPDVPLFCHPGALVKLAAWVAEAVAVLEAEKGHVSRKRNEDEALVLGALDEARGVYVVVGLGGGANASGRVRSKAEIREREDKKKRKAAEKAAREAEKKRKREERHRLRKERDAANGLVDSDAEDDDGEDSDSTESDDSSNSESSSDSDSDADADVATAKRRKRQALRNRFGQAFQEVVEETSARVRIDSFEHSVVEVRKEDLAGFLEALSMKSVLG